MNTLPVVKFALVDIEVERFAVAMAAAVVELVVGLELVAAADVPTKELSVHCRSDYPDAVPMTVAQRVNRLAVVAAELKVVYRFD